MANISASKASKEKKAKTIQTFQDDRMLLIKNSPFYGMLLLHFTPVPSTQLAAISTNRKIYLGCQEGEELTEDDYLNYSAVARQTLLIHELLHVALDHLSMPGNLNKDISNVSQDAVINRIIQADPTLQLDALPPGCVRPFGKGDYNAGYDFGKEHMVIPEFFDLDWVGIYQATLERLKKDSDGGGGLEKRIQKFLAGAGPMHGDSQMEDSQSMTPEQAQAAQAMRQLVITTFESCKLQGSLPAEIERLINAIGESKVPWKHQLARMIRTHIAQDDFSWKFNSRRAHIGFFPRMESEALGDVWLALDTSGSMSQEALSQGVGEFRSVRQVSPMNLHLICCDCQTYTLQSFERHEEPAWDDILIEGGGGTSFVPVFNLIEQKREEGFEKPCLLIFFTDTYGDFPAEAPDYPVIWVTVGGQEVPWGEQIEIGDC